MVKHDCENPESSQKYIDRLKEIHVTTKKLKDEIEDLQLTQFSDSVVLALPFKASEFENFAKLVSDYQFNLLSNGILCRGGISYGMHHFDGDFLFSNGLIHAYNIEKDISIHPRIVASKDLINLVYQDESEIPRDTIIKESDGAYFINYLSHRKPDEAKQAIELSIPRKLSENPSIRGKQIWMIDYYNHAFPDSPIDRLLRFS
ncbi:hypothetical protein [Pseudomonas nitroreducens]|uniref:Uncharacterized protein n=1 Tax=Pseudomonas nitroreducens TaxID=46680 RepID=A0ABS0KSI8_PSENT|nr:hypothetical protein [Pseudomonas nitroreducens]MBG6291067.1 hypothetical protein [Pseudomonas nitroreducens]NMZ61102.1 hypothetical protein [Pseudomonas nitroreducens]